MNGNNEDEIEPDESIQEELGDEGEKDRKLKFLRRNKTK